MSSALAPFALGLLGQQRLCRGSRLCRPSHREQQCSSLFAGGTAQLFEPLSFGLGERPVDELFKRRASPQPQGVVDETEGLLTPSVRGGGEELLELPRIDVPGVDGQAIAAVVGDQRRPPGQSLAQPRHLRAERSCGIVGQVITPQLLGSRSAVTVRLASRSRSRQHQALEATANADSPVLGNHDKRAEDAKLRSVRMPFTHKASIPSTPGPD